MVFLIVPHTSQYFLKSINIAENIYINCLYLSLAHLATKNTMPIIKFISLALLMLLLTVADNII